MAMANNKTNLTERLTRLYGRRQFGIKPGLDAVKHLCELLDNPQESFAAIHVAGTNGKGSVCAMIESMVRASGINTGLYTSPHLVHFNERIRINGNDIPDAELAEVLDVCEAAATKLHHETGHEATFFEIATVMAFESFRRAGISLAIIETGLGGRLDATNIITPLLSVITGISLEHTAWLGETIREVASEKCGIIKQGRPVVAAPQTHSEATRVIHDRATACKAPLIWVADAVEARKISGNLSSQKIQLETVNGLGLTARLPLIGSHQLENAAVALATVETFFNILGKQPDTSALIHGLASVRWPGRCQLLRDNPPVLLDAAHNPAGAKTLTNVLRQNKTGRVAIVLGMCRDKDVDGVVAELSRVAARVWVAPLDNERGIPPDELARITRAHGLESTVASSANTALESAAKWAAANSMPVVVTGSLFLLGEILKNA